MDKEKIYVVTSSHKMSIGWGGIVGISDNLETAIEIAENEWKKRCTPESINDNGFEETSISEMEYNAVQNQFLTPIWGKNIIDDGGLPYLSEEKIKRRLECLSYSIENSSPSMIPAYFYRHKSLIKKHLGDMEGAAKDMEIYVQLTESDE
ncbi:MAG: hypothetical protein LBI15_03050 [Dysgonamonadaceae bacterium]|jgi:hypothetical protein|nr:hypothetical protein [Dysgonamonadaceae bacterium]